MTALVVKLGEAGCRGRHRSLLCSFLPRYRPGSKHLDGSRVNPGRSLGEADLSSSKVMIYSYHIRKGRGTAEGPVVEVRSPEGNGTFWPLLAPFLITCTPSNHALLDRLTVLDSRIPEQAPTCAQLEFYLIA